jgi:hypothetical protein
MHLRYAKPSARPVRRHTRDCQPQGAPRHGYRLAQARHVAVDTAHGRPAACGSATDLDSFLLLEPRLFMVSDAALQGGAVTYYDMSVSAGHVSHRGRSGTDGGGGVLAL